MKHELMRKRRILRNYENANDNSEHARVARLLAGELARRKGKPEPTTREAIVGVLAEHIAWLEGKQ